MEAHRVDEPFRRGQEPRVDEAVLAAARAEPNVARALQGKRIVKEIYVPNRIVNFVIAG